MDYKRFYNEAKTVDLLEKSHYILTNRLSLLTTALADAQEEYKEYRNCVKENMVKK